jgi:hypothetical protein
VISSLLASTANQGFLSMVTRKFIVEHCNSRIYEWICLSVAKARGETLNLQHLGFCRAREKNTGIG